ncbi:cytoskeleton protein RodZ [Oxalobacteraceae bacterium GrIS 1.11]
MNSEWAEQPQSQGKLGAPGAQLKAQRIAMGWTVEQVADQLKLAPRQVVALEEGDSAALPNLAVVRGFIRAYAKVAKLDPVPLVAMIEVNPVASADAAPARREISATFSEARFPSMTQRSSKLSTWIIVALVAVVVAAFAAYKMGYVSPAMLTHVDKDARPAASAPAGATPAASSGTAVETTLVKPGQELTPLQSTAVPLISVPPTSAPPASASSATAAPAAAQATTGDALVLTAAQDSWVEIRRKSGAPLMSRILKAGASETINITEPVLLIVGKPAGVQATLRGATLELKSVPGGTTSRLNIK